MDLYLHTYGLRRNYHYREGFDVFSFLDIAANHGFQGVNISAYAPAYRELSGAEPDHLARVRKYAERRGLAIDVEANGTKPAALAELFTIAEALGAGAVRTYTTPGGIQRNEDWPRGLDTVEDRIAQAVPDLVEAARLAEQLSIPIVVENHEELTGSEKAELLAKIDSPWVGALFDYGNSMCNGEEPLVALNAMAPWIRTAHVKDQVFRPRSDGDPDGHLGNLIGVPIGRGILPIREITQRLVELGVGRVCLEDCWDYSTYISDWRGGGQLGTGAFVDRDGSHAYDAGHVSHAELPALELETLETSITGFKECVAGLAGISPLQHHERDVESPAQI